MIKSIFEQYYNKADFIDRYDSSTEIGVEVIIPVYHTNEVWESNLLSIYREVPVKKLILSDGGVLDDSIELAKKFPRVEVLNHRHYKSLGKCIAKLIEHVESEWFIYLHSDVFLPEGWFDKMVKYQDEYDWFGCPMHITVAATYVPPKNVRPYAGSQMGRKKAFSNLDKIDDDFVYRQEDFVFNKLVVDNGFKPGKIEDTFHYHQVMYRKSKGLDLKIRDVNVILDRGEEERIRTNETQLRGLVKYLDPNEPWALSEFQAFAKIMHDDGLIGFRSFRKWIEVNNRNWLEVYNYQFILRYHLKRYVSNTRRLMNYVFNKFLYILS